MRRATICTALLAASLVAGAVACGDDDSSATTTTTTTTLPGPVGSASEATCAARDELQTSISDLSKIDVVRNGTSSITDALTRIKDALGDLRSAAGEDLQPQIDAFQQSLEQLQTAVGGGVSQATAIVTAIRGVGTTGGTLLASLRNMRCP